MDIVSSRLELTPRVQNGPALIQRGRFQEKEIWNVPLSVLNEETRKLSSVKRKALAISKVLSEMPVRIETYELIVGFSVHKHEQMTGVGNAVILENLKRIDERGKPIWVRVPLIPGYNDSIENLRQVAEFTKTLANAEKISLLPYNGAAGAKYVFMGRKYRLERLEGYTKQEEEDFTKLFSSAGIEVEVGR